MNKVLQSLCDRNGNTKRIKTPEQARAVLAASWAEKFGDKWCIAGVDQFRPASKSEAKLLTDASLGN